MVERLVRKEFLNHTTEVVPSAAYLHPRLPGWSVPQFSRHGTAEPPAAHELV